MRGGEGGKLWTGGRGQEEVVRRSEKGITVKEEVCGEEGSGGDVRRKGAKM